MKTVVSSLEASIERFSKLANVGFKFSLALGSICVIVYALRIGYFPQGLSLGDGLLLLIAAGCFGVVYALFVGCILSLGVSLSPIIRLIFRVILWGMKKITGSTKQPVHKLAPFKLIAIPFALITVAFIWKFGQRDMAAYWKLPLLSIFLYLIYSAALSLREKARQAEKLVSSVVYTPEKEQALRSGDVERHSSIYLFLIGCMMLLPLMIGGVSGQLLDGAMRLAHVRIEQPIIYVKAPYNALLPASLIAQALQVPEGYTAYGDIAVLFKGFGNTTVLAFKDGEYQRQLEVPNDEVIVEVRNNVL